MLTIFTIPKGFAGHTGVIQRNAIRSWLALRPECEVILFGNDPGTAECAEQFGVRHVPDVACNEYGTPRIDDAFRQAAGLARFPLLCYVNADIILPARFTACVKRIRFPRFLMVGQRVDVDVESEIDPADTWSRRSLEKLVREDGTVHPPVAIDYFVFPKGSLGDLPPFVVGRPGWDNWMIFRATQLRVPVVDASGCSLVIHQNHGYAHVPGGKGSWEGPEADRNREILGSVENHFALWHAGWRLTEAGLVRQPWWNQYHPRAIARLSAAYPRLRPLFPCIRFALRGREYLHRRLYADS